MKFRITIQQLILVFGILVALLAMVFLANYSPKLESNQTLPSLSLPTRLPALGEIVRIII